MIQIRFPIRTETAFGSHPRCIVSVTYRIVLCFHGGNTGSNPVGDANRTKSIENRPKVINQEAFTCFKDPAFYPPRQSLGEQRVLKVTLTMKSTFASCLFEVDHLGLGLLHQVSVT